MHRMDPRAHHHPLMLASIAIGLALAALLAGGCDEARRAMDHIEGAAIVAPKAPDRQAENVIPTAEPIERLTLTTVDERSLAGLATALGATIDDIMIDNGLDDSRVGAGAELQVRTTRSRLKRYLNARARRQARRAERAAAAEIKGKGKSKRHKKKRRARASAKTAN